jgi:hypothetical protein
MFRALIARLVCVKPEHSLALGLPGILDLNPEAGGRSAIVMSDEDKAGGQDDGTDAGRSRALIAAGVVVVLMVVGFLLARELTASAKLQDCLMSGRTNCAPIDTRH